jgi:hypothetical protein
MNKEQQELLDEAYLNYSYSCIRETKKQEHEMKEKGGWLTLCLTPFFENKEEFINKCKTDPEFSETWGLKIEERELSLEERVDYKKKRDGIARTFASYTHQMLDGSNIPTKLITLTYRDQKIESYEYSH